MIYVYVLRSQKADRFYVGMTSDLDRRIKEHNCGHTKSTRGFIPWIVFFSEECKDYEEGRKREKFLKSGVGKEFIKNKWSGSSAG
jgi:putative endonuclease